MLDELIEAISIHGQNGQAIYDEIFDAEFKARYDQMDSYAEAHENGQCDDPNCICKEFRGQDAQG